MWEKKSLFLKKVENLQQSESTTPQWSNPLVGEVVWVGGAWVWLVDFERESNMAAGWSQAIPYSKFPELFWFVQCYWDWYKCWQKLHK